MNYINELKGERRIKFSEKVLENVSIFLMRDEAWSRNDAFLECDLIKSAMIAKELTYKPELFTKEMFCKYPRIGAKKQMSRVERTKMYSLFENAIKHALFAISQ